MNGGIILLSQETTPNSMQWTECLIFINIDISSVDISYIDISSVDRASQQLFCEFISYSA